MCVCWAANELDDYYYSAKIMSYTPPKIIIII